MICAADSRIAPAIARRIRWTKPVWADVRRRRRLYFCSLFLTVALVLMPIWVGRLPVMPVYASGHGLLGGTIGLIGAVLPAFLGGVVETWADHPLLVVLLVTLLILANLSARGIERRLREETRRVWNLSLDLPKPYHGQTSAEPLQPVTEQGPEYPVPDFWQSLRRKIRWGFIPLLVLALIVTLALWVLAAFGTRVFLAGLERGACGAAQSAAPSAAAATFTFETGKYCNPTGMTVVKGQIYAVEIEVAEVWKDDRQPTDPRGLSARDLGLAGYLGAPLRRAVSANYLQPVAHIRGQWPGPILQPIELQRRAAPLTGWRGEFKAHSSGRLSFVANDAAPPYFRRFFYDNNSGTARVRVTLIRSLPEKK